MQKNYVQEILSIIHSGLPKAELAEKKPPGRFVPPSQG